MKWKNIPDVVLSVYTSILQQLVATQVYRRNEKNTCILFLDLRLGFRDFNGRNLESASFEVNHEDGDCRSWPHEAC